MSKFSPSTIARFNSLGKTVDTKISGIPCVAALLPQAESELEFGVYDTRGYPAAWLEAKMTYSERHAIAAKLYSSATEVDY